VISEGAHAYRLMRRSSSGTSPRAGGGASYPDRL